MTLIVKPIQDFVTEKIIPTWTDTDENVPGWHIFHEENAPDTSESKYEITENGIIKFFCEVAGSRIFGTEAITMLLKAQPLLRANAIHIEFECLRSGNGTSAALGQWYVFGGCYERDDTVGDHQGATCAGSKGSAARGWGCRGGNGGHENYVSTQGGTTPQIGTGQNWKKLIVNVWDQPGGNVEAKCNFSGNGSSLAQFAFNGDTDRRIVLKIGLPEPANPPTATWVKIRNIRIWEGAELSNAAGSEKGYHAYNHSAGQFRLTGGESVHNAVGSL